MKTILLSILLLLSLTSLSQRMNHPYKSDMVMIGDITDSSKKPTTVFTTTTFTFYKKDATPAFSLAYPDATRYFTVTDKLMEKTVDNLLLHVWAVKENNDTRHILQILFSTDGKVLAIAIVTAPIILFFPLQPDIPTLES
jgi:hypothetical protein